MEKMKKSQLEDSGKKNSELALEKYFEKNSELALAFSGGTDSSYLLFAAARAGADITAYFVRSQFQPEFELQDARNLVDWLEQKFTKSVKFRIIELDVLSDNRIAENAEDRCYYCKHSMMEAIREEAKADGYSLLIDGTNASDEADDRPGMRATAELGVRSPLRELGISKAEVRRLSEEAGLPTAAKPAYACLASRIPCGMRITASDLQLTEQSESFMQALGFSDFRIRLKPTRIVPESDLTASRTAQLQTDLTADWTAQLQTDLTASRTALVQINSRQIGLLEEKRSELIAYLLKHYDAIEFDKNYR